MREGNGVADLDGRTLWELVEKRAAASPDVLMSKDESGRTMTYGEVAKELGEPGSARAVGQALGRNPFAPVIPCHRVVGAKGELTGYGGGLETKRWLLENEGVLMPLGS